MILFYRDSYRNGRQVHFSFRIRIYNVEPVVVVSFERNNLVCVGSGSQTGCLPSFSHHITRDRIFTHENTFLTISGTGSDDSQFCSSRPGLSIECSREVDIQAFPFETLVVIRVWLACCSCKQHTA